MKKTFIITIDGPSSSGKSTIAKLIAAHYKFTYIDSGSIYRLITYIAIKNKLFENELVNTKSIINSLKKNAISFSFNSKNQNVITLNNKPIEKEIRTFEISNLVSIIAEKKEIRDYVLNIQKTISKNKSIVMDGRDIGSVVFPQADVKFFIDASLDVRAKRRWKDLIVNEKNILLSDVKNDLQTRDQKDMNRKSSPLIIPKNSIKIITDEININELINKMIHIIDVKIKNK